MLKLTISGKTGNWSLSGELSDLAEDLLGYPEANQSVEETVSTFKHLHPEARVVVTR